LLYAGLVTGFVVGTAAHEGGHFVCAVMSSIPVRSLSIGGGPVLLRVRINETSLELRQNLWAGGLIVFYPALTYRKCATMFALTGGLLGDVALVALVIWLTQVLAVPYTLGMILAGVVLSQLLTIAVNLFPSTVKVDNETLETDGLQLWHTLCGPRSGPTQQGSIFKAMLRVCGGEESSVSGAAPRLCYHLSRDRWGNEAVRREVDDALQRELKRDGLTREEQLLVLDALATDALLFGDPDLRARLDKWSLRALALGPTIRTIRGTRGSALVELGRYAEAKLLLEPLTSAEETSLDRILSHASLARAEQALGAHAAARRHVSEARRMCSARERSRAPGTVEMPKTIASFVERIAVDVGVDEQQAESDRARNSAI
jgi:hypothetical protein